MPPVKDPLIDAVAMFPNLQKKAMELNCDRPRLLAEYFRECGRRFPAKANGLSPQALAVMCDLIGDIQDGIPRKERRRKFFDGTDESETESESESIDDDQSKLDVSGTTKIEKLAGKHSPPPPKKDK